MPDTALGTTLVNLIVQAREAFDARNGTLSKNRLQMMINTVTGATPAQRRLEVEVLLTLNIQRIMETIPDTSLPPPAMEPKVSLSPSSIDLPIGTEYTLDISVVNLADDNKPLSPFSMGMNVVEGPHSGQMEFSIITDIEGKASRGYTGQRVGTDRVNITPDNLTGEGPVLGSVEVNWTGGPDLAVPFFIPPVLKINPNGTVLVTEKTTNLGNVSSGPSITRYFLSDQEPVNPLTAAFIGERSVPVLQPGETQGEASPIAFSLPGGLLAGGVYFMTACADAESIVIELDEENNCSFSQIPGKTIVVPMEESSNLPPDCSGAIPNVDLLWPPNHKFVAISIQRVSDPEGRPISITMMRITQDEPVEGTGAGNTSPDGMGIGTSALQIRAERSGAGNGRVYHITFKAEDEQGESCDGLVRVGVPHDQGNGFPPIDDGQLYDSTSF